MSPYFSNSFVDANFFDKTDPVEDKAVDDILELANNDEINLLIPYSVQNVMSFQTPEKILHIRGVKNYKNPLGLFKMLIPFNDIFNSSCKNI